jgi:osmoprotectant transport system ATP-binding protein
MNATQRPESAVSWRDVEKTYPDGHRALAGVSLDVAPGEVLAVLGTSGSGKTTLLKTVNRLTDPTAGRVLVRGKPTTDWEPVALRRSIGYVIQEAGLLPHLTVLANVGIVPRLLGTPKRERDKRAGELLELVGLDPAKYGQRKPRELSGGQRQRVGVARALAADPDLVLMDEPFGALDPVTRRDLQDEFRGLQRRLGKSVVFVTHDVREACRIADRLAVMDGGRLVQHGTPADLMERPANDFVRSFVADARAVDAAGGGTP